MNHFFINFLVKKAISPSNFSRPPPTIAPLPAPSTPASRPLYPRFRTLYPRFRTLYPRIPAPPCPPPLNEQKTNLSYEGRCTCFKLGFKGLRCVLTYPRLFAYWTVILLPAHPASFAHDFVSGMHSFYFSESQDAIVLQTCH